MYCSHYERAVRHLGSRRKCQLPHMRYCKRSTHQARVWISTELDLTDGVQKVVRRKIVTGRLLAQPGGRRRHRKLVRINGCLLVWKQTVMGSGQLWTQHGTRALGFFFLVTRLRGFGVWHSVHRLDGPSGERVWKDEASADFKRLSRYSALSQYEDLALCGF